MLYEEKIKLWNVAYFKFIRQLNIVQLKKAIMNVFTRLNTQPE